jgi:hypothetical protein
MSAAFLICEAFVGAQWFVAETLSGYIGTAWAAFVAFPLPWIVITGLLNAFRD